MVARFISGCRAGSSSSRKLFRGAASLPRHAVEAALGQCALNRASKFPAGRGLESPLAAGIPGMPVMAAPEIAHTLDQANWLSSASHFIYCYNFCCSVVSAGQASSQRKTKEKILDIHTGIELRFCNRLQRF
jgi:hypothetical protein